MVATPEDFDWDDDEEELSWELPLFRLDGANDNEVSSMADRHIPRQLRFRVDTGMAARSLNERNSEPRFESPQLY